MEAGDSSVSLDMLIGSLITLGASDRELSKIIATHGLHKEQGRIFRDF